MRLGYEDAVLELYEPIVRRAADELDAALIELRPRLEVEPSSIGLMGGSLGAAVPQLVLAEGKVAAAAAVLISPVVQLRRAIEAGERLHGFSYRWTERASAAADRLDFVVRAAELARPPAAVLAIVGERDDAGFREPAEHRVAALRRHGGGAEPITIPEMGHALAEEPGTAAAPQTTHAAAVDRHAVAWFARHLGAEILPVRTQGALS
jgi:dienelactone hydrolase